MVLICGLGNFGKEYENTRHNAGFMALDFLFNKYGKGNFLKKFDGLIADGEILNEKIIFAKPETYMNLSGICIGKICKFYKIKPENVIVIHDELDIPLGKIKVKQGGGNAGHNGLKSIDSHLGKDYFRIRIGISRPDNDFDVSDWVLSKFSKQELSEVNWVVSDIENEVLKIIQEIKARPTNEPC